MATSNGSTTVFVGAHVMSADGKQLGVVKDARIDRFLVDVRWAPDYWLGVETVENSSPDTVQLVIPKQGIGSAKIHMEVAGPGIN